MSKKIKIIGNAVIVEDTVTLDITLDKPSKDIYYDSDALANEKIILIITLPFILYFYTL